jgi:hypothetical protein
MIRVDKRYFKYIIICFLLTAMITLFIEGNQLLAAKGLTEVPQERGLAAQLRVKVRNFLLYSKISHLAASVIDNKSYQTRKDLEEIAVNLLSGTKFSKLNIDRSQLISDIGYKNGRVYLNLSNDIYKLDVFEHFLVIESLVKLFADLGGVEDIQFLIGGHKGKLSAHLDITRPIRVRKDDAKIAIIIDDFGNRAEGTDSILKLKQKITCAIIPFKDDSTEEGEYAKNLGFDVIIHLPMESELDRPNWMGAKPILTTLSKEEIRSRMEEAIEDIPTAVGFNNHTGGKATADRRVMKVLLEVAKQRGLVAIDSRTTPKTVVAQVGKEVGVRVLERDVFLDHKKDYGYIREAMLDLAGRAISQGSAIGIGHVGPHGGNVTALVLKNMLNPIERAGVEFVGISSLINNK